MSIPVEFRRVLEAGDPNYTDGLRPKFIIVYGNKEQMHLEAYTIEEARKLEAKIDRLPNSKLKRKLIRENISCSIESEIDPDGRMVIPQRYRDKIDLDTEAVFVGTLGTFQIWAPDHYDAHLEATDGEDDLGVDIPDNVTALDALDIVLAKQEAP